MSLKDIKNLCFLCSTILLFLPSKLHTHFWFWKTQQGARFCDKHGTALHLFVILLPVQCMGKRFAVETRGEMTIQATGFLI